MKRYLLFTFAQYEPSGGWNDFNSSYDSLERALVAAAKRDHSMERFQILDTKTWLIVADDVTGLYNKPSKVKPKVLQAIEAFGQYWATKAAVYHRVNDGHNRLVISMNHDADTLVVQYYDKTIAQANPSDLFGADGKPIIGQILAPTID